MEPSIWAFLSLFFAAFVVSFIAEAFGTFRNIEAFKAAWNDKTNRRHNLVYPFIIQTAIIFVVLVILWYVRG